MSESTQHKLDRVRKPRVHITYDVHIGDAVQKKEIPYIIGILADLSGMPKNELPLIAKRNFINIDRDNINDVLKASNARLNFNVKNKINPQDENLNVELNFKTMSDFDPLSIVQQTPELNKVFAQKIKLMDLLAKMENNAILRDIIKLLAEDTDFRNQFKDYLASRKKTDGLDQISTVDEQLAEDESIEKIIKAKIKAAEEKILSGSSLGNTNNLANQFPNINHSSSDTTTQNTTNGNDAKTENPKDTKDNTKETPVTVDATNDTTKTSQKADVAKPKENNNKPQTQSTNNPKVEK